MNILQLGDLKFQVTSAVVTGYLVDGVLSWTISIETEERVVGGALWKPRAYSERLLQLEGGVVEYWQDAFHKPVVWKDCYDEASETSNALLYVFGHHDIYESRLDILPKEGGEISIDWKAQCDVLYGTYQKNVPLVVLTTGTFGGLEVGFPGEQLSESEAFARLRRSMLKGAYKYCAGKSHCDPPVMCFQGDT